MGNVCSRYEKWKENRNYVTMTIVQRRWRRPYFIILSPHFYSLNWWQLVIVLNTSLCYTFCFSATISSVAHPIHFTVSCANLAQVVFKMFPVSLAPMFFVCPTGTVLLHRGIFIVSSTCCRFFYLFNKSHVVCGIFQFDIFFLFATVVTFSTAEKHFTTN